MLKRQFSMVIILVVLFCGNSVASQTYKIGVLAKNGPVKAMQMWKSTSDYLNSKLDNNTFEIVPLDFDAVNPAIEEGKVDFFIVNSSMFVTAKIKFGAAAVATMINSRQGQPLKSFGGVIITAEENDEISTLSDLKGKTFMAVKNSSFGGWQMAYKEILDAGIDPLRDFSKLEFGGKHANVVFAIQNGVFDAGTVRTDTLERMAAEGSIELSDFKIIHQKTYQEFPFVCSTALYPEWPIAKTKHVPESVAEQMVSALKQLKSTDKAAQDAKIIGWVQALDYGPVEELQNLLKIGAYEG